MAEQEHEHAVAETVARVDRAEVGEQIGTAAHAAIPQLHRHGDPEMVPAAVRAARSNVAAVAEGLLTGIDATDIPAPAVSLEWSEWLMQRGVDVSAIPWAYSFGQARLAEALREVVASLDLAPGLKWELGDGLTRYVNEYVASMCAQMVDHFTEAEVRWHQGPGAQRHETVQALLDGRLTDADTASEALGYRLTGDHVGALVWADPHLLDRPAEHALNDTAGRLLHACGAREVLVLAHGPGTAWAWGTGGALTDAPEATPLDRGLLAAVGDVAGGLDGFVRTHRDATRAKRMAELLGRRPGTVVRYRAIALTSMIASDPGQALRFVEDELGPLADDSDAMRRVRATVAVYLEESMRATRTARRLGVHTNTVAYRIQQAEAAMGRSLTERRLEFEAALRLADARDELRASARRL